MILGPELARHRPKDAGSDRLGLIVDQHGGVRIEPDYRPVRAADVLGGAHHHRLHHVALLDATARDRLLDRDDDDVADRGVPTLRSAQNFDAHHAPRARIVGDAEIGLHLYHGLAAFFELRLRRRLADDDPALELRDRARLLDRDGVADLLGLVFDVRVVVLRPAHGLLQ